LERFDSSALLDVDGLMTVTGVVAVWLFIRTKTYLKTSGDCEGRGDGAGPPGAHPHWKSYDGLMTASGQAQSYSRTISFRSRRSSRICLAISWCTVPLDTRMASGLPVSSDGARMGLPASSRPW
jgi:hypothetical protein